MARGVTGSALDQRVTIQRLARTSDGMGGFTEAWSDIGAVWAQILPLRGAEKWEAMRVSPDSRMKARIRWRGDAAGQQRLTAVALAVTLDPAAAIRWKCADGHFRVLDAAQVIAAAQAVRAYVQACYDREAEMLAALDAGEPVDVDAGWP